MLDTAASTASIVDEYAAIDSETFGYSGSNEYAVDAFVSETDTADEIAALEAAYASELTDESDPLDTAPRVQGEESAVVYSILYTTNPMGDLPSTVVFDSHVGEYNGRVVRKLGVPAEGVEAQRASAGSGARFLCVGEGGWAALQEGTHPTGGRAQERSLEEHTARLLTPRCDPNELAEWQALTTEEQHERARYQPQTPESTSATDEAETPDATPGEEPEIPQAILEAEALAQAAKAMAEQYKAMQAQMKRMEEQTKALQAQAAAAKAAAPVLITPELRAKIDIFLAIGAGGEQGIAKALVNAQIHIPLRHAAKADTGTIRKVAQTPSSSGVVDVHRNGTGSTVVNPGNNVMTEEKRAIILAIKARLAALPPGIIADTQIAKQVGLDPRNGAKLVYNIRVGASHTDVN